MARAARAAPDWAIAGLDVTVLRAARPSVRAGRPGWAAPVGSVLLVAVIALGGAWAAQAAGTPSGSPTFLLPVPGGGPVGSAARLCRDPVRAALPHAGPVFLSFDSSLWTDGRRVLLCATDHGRVSVLRYAAAATRGPALVPSVVQVGRTAYVPHRRYVAVGVVPPGVRGVTYRFPDGQAVVGRVVDDGHGHRTWLVDYAPVRGILTDLRVPVGDLPPLRVELVAGDGTAETLRVPWTHVPRGLGTGTGRGSAAGP